MSLMSVKNISMAFGGPKVLDSVSFLIEKNQRIALMGANGEGKSTLLKILAGIICPDEGELIYHDHVHIAYMPQDVPDCGEETAFDVVMDAFKESEGTALLRDKEHLWEVEHKCSKILSKMGLPELEKFKVLSGGTQRRVLLAKALVTEPDVLLLDEPTNHMDLETIEWLQKQLMGYRGTVIFVTHDRVFLKNISNRIIELDRGKAFEWECGYDKFLDRKEAWLEAEEKRNSTFDKKLAEEEIWIRRGIKARRTRNEGRVRALMQLRQERSQRRERMGKVRLTMQEFEESGRVIFKVHNLCHSFDDIKIVEKFNALIMRGDRIALIGPNGSGKTTLLRLLLKKLEPISGNVKSGVDLEVAYFDQHRAKLDEERTVEYNVAEGAPTVTINGNPRHVLSYLRGFNFSPDRAKTPVKALSGGERNRLLLAKLFTKPSNVLVLDEPTNDLDIETLELLEEMLVQYTGTILLVSHDRSFINNVVTATYVYEGNGHWHEYGGGYDDWIKQSLGKVSVESAVKKKSKLKTKKIPAIDSSKARQADNKRKIKYGEKLELEKIPVMIEEQEIKQNMLIEQMSAPEFYKQDDEKIKAVTAEAENVKKELERLFARWEELDALEE